MTRIDPEALVADLKRLRTTSAETSATGIVQRLERAVDAVNALFGHRGAGLMFAEEGGTARCDAARRRGGRREPRPLGGLP